MVLRGDGTDRGEPHPVAPASYGVLFHDGRPIIKLLDGTKAYLHGVIDNFSRRILAWTVAERLDPMPAQAASNGVPTTVQRLAPR